jgi:hypothetical protein
VHGRDARLLHHPPTLATNKEKSFWKKQLQLGNEIFRSWEETYLFATAPKCLWPHKYMFIHRKETARIMERRFLQGNRVLQGMGSD